MDGLRRWVAAAAAVVVVVVLLAVAPAGGAPPTQATLPLPTLSSTDLHVGDVVTVAGTGCVAPDTGRGSGLTAEVFRWVPGRSMMQTNEVRLPVADDGSYSGEWTVTQALPDGPATVGVWCFGEALGDTLLEASGAIATGTAPMLPDVVGAPGAVVPVTYPCGSDGYGLSAVVQAPNLPYGSTQIIESVGVVGQAVDATIPPDLAPGTYPGTAQCNSDGGAGAYFRLRLVVTDPGAPSAGPPAPPAAPQQGSSSYTG